MAQTFPVHSDVPLQRKNHALSAGALPGRMIVLAVAIFGAAAGIRPVSADTSAPPVTAGTHGVAESTALLLAQQEVFRAAVGRVSKCVVTIETVGGTQPTEGFPATSAPAGGGRPRAVMPAGFIVADGPTTGLIYSADGLILTSAFNFVRDPSLITVVLSDRRRFVAELLARDEVRQLAMIKIDAKDLPTPAWRESLAGLEVGQWTLALGRGLGGEEPSITTGIVSGLNRQSGLAVQTDARLSPANFGGPVIDIDGHVIGLAVPMGLTTGIMAGVELYDSGVGFLIPYPQIRISAESLSVGHNLRRGLLGVTLAQRGGLRITAIADPSPALRAGLQKDDQVFAVDGRPVKKYAELQRLMRARLAGQRITVTIDRDGRKIDVPLVLAVPEDLGKVPQDTPGASATTQISPESPEPPHRDRE